MFIRLFGAAQIFSALFQQTTRNMFPQPFSFIKSVSGGGEYVKVDEATTNNDFDEIGNSASCVSECSSFTTTDAYSISRVTVLIYKIGSPTFNITAKIMADNAGVPDGTALATSSAISSATLSTSAAAVNFDFASAAALSTGTKYHIVLETSSLGDASNCAAARINYNTATGQSLSRYNGSVYSPRYTSSQFVFSTWKLT